eukprot:TRINITY_DN2207_c1_g1_i3.p1 TRINITY_DN2207_c1_g1~~TRINITY_DN2207_c1_g1_i3.p1  ORF type:complete len:736 (-),score=66.03 TRINITY_DN2207_c1_g1_i3:498-2705(-)
MQRRQGNMKLRLECFKQQELGPEFWNSTWGTLQNAIHQIQNKNSSGLSFEELYRSGYNLVLHKFGEQLYQGVVRELRAHASQVAELIVAVQGKSFLRELRDRWNDHYKSSQMIKDVLMYMDRTYVSTHKKTPVFQLGLEVWKECVIDHPQIQPRLLELTMDMIARERQGEVIERQLLASIIQMLVTLGTKVYRTIFEEPFLRQASDFYCAEAQKYLNLNDCMVYLKHTENRLQQEVDRVESYLDKSTLVKIQNEVQKQLILKQMRALVEMEGTGFIAQLQHDKLEDLKRMYQLFKCVDDGHKLLKEEMGKYVFETGRVLIMEDSGATKDPATFVLKLLVMKDKYDKIITQSFMNDRYFVQALTLAFEKFINLNQRSPEYISLFIDDKLRKGLKGLTEENVDLVLDKVMMLFRFLQEKDLFEKYYKQHLAKRLLSGRSVSDDAERSMLIKLKQECGYQFTSKLESMFNDIKTSTDMMDNFKKNHLVAKGVALGLDLQVQVLTTGSWPTSNVHQCNIPLELAQCKDEFEKFYASAYSGRKLSWQTNMGSADIKAWFGSKTHELNVSTYQLCILMLFNDSNELSYKDIQSATNIPDGDLRRNLQSLALVKGKNVLKKSPMSKEINDDDKFTFNDAFTSKLYKVKIGTVSAQKETEPEKIETRNRVEEDRKPQIEAAIVRIMKARRVLDHNSIIAEVNRQLSSRFQPSTAVVKQRIESLIEREFIERDATDRKKYRYLA